MNSQRKERSLIKAELLCRALIFTVKIPNVLLEEILASFHAVQHADETEVHEVVTFDQSTQTYLPSVPDGYSNAEAQTEDFEYVFVTPRYKAQTEEYFHSSEKVRFYTGLPSYDVLLIVFEHVAPHVPCRATVVDTFQEFVMVLIKLQLNVPFQDLAYCLNISLSSVSRIFNSWIAVRLSCSINWPDRKELVLPVDI